jgi:hypothetical protein
MIIYLSNPAESNGQQADRGTLIGTRGFIRSARLLPNSIEFQGRFASESACADYLSSAVGREGSTVPIAAMAEPSFAEPQSCRSISHVTCKAKSSTVSAAELGCIILDLCVTLSDWLYWKNRRATHHRLPEKLADSGCVFHAASAVSLSAKSGLENGIITFEISPSLYTFSATNPKK